MRMSRGRGSSAVAVLLSLAALAVSIVALCYAIRERGVAGRGLSAYDMRTPQAAVKSLLRMEAYGDVLAQMQMEQAMSASNRIAKEKEAESLSYGKTYTCEGNTVVLYSFVRDGKPRYEVQWLGHDSSGGYHALVGMPEWCFEDPAGKEGEIANAVRDWEAKNTTPAAETFPATPNPAP